MPMAAKCISDIHKAVKYHKYAALVFSMVINAESSGSNSFYFLQSELATTVKP